VKMAMRTKSPPARKASSPKTSGAKTAAPKMPAAETSAAEWIAASLGAALTLGVLGYSLWEGVAGSNGPPVLSAQAQGVTPTGAGYVAAITLRNEGGDTAAGVEVRGELAIPGRPAEERRATFAYVPAGGEAAGGLVFQGDPRQGRLSLSVEGYEKP